MRQIGIAVAAIVLAFAASAAQASPWKVDRQHTFVNFEVTHLGLIPYPGRFKDAFIDLHYNPANVEQSSVEVRIPVKSVETDDGLTNEILTGEQFFDERNYPDIRFKSTGIRRTGENTGIITGELTMVGNTRTVEMPATFQGKAKHPFTGAPVIGITAEAEVDRTKWGLSAWRPFVGDIITIRIAFEASPE